jgi:hypothetical protein
MEASTTEAVAVKTPEQRKELLARAIASEIAQGARVESQSDYQAVMIKGKGPNHVLHLILTLVTFGLWALVWSGVVAFGGERRRLIEIDPYGNTIIPVMPDRKFHER